MQPSLAQEDDWQLSGDRDQPTRAGALLVVRGNNDLAASQDCRNHAGGGECTWCRVDG